MDYSPNPIENTKLNIGGSQKSPLNLRETENQAEEADAAVRHYAHPLENHFASTGARGPLGRGVSKQLARQLGVLNDEE